MKTAIIAVSRAGIRQACRLKGIYPQANIYVPGRFCSGRENPARIEKNADRSNICPADQSVFQGFVEGREANAGSFSGQGISSESFSPVDNGSGWNCNSFDHKTLNKPVSNNSKAFQDGKSSPGFSDSCILSPLTGSFSEAVGALFNTYRLLIFISAVAVAARAVAPFLKGKDSDPAIVVLDEQARFAISLLSGHLGGANEETAKIANHMGAQPVITTATDSRGLTAFDDLARMLGWKIENLSDLKAISSALLEEREVILYSEYPFSYPLQGNIRVVKHLELLKEASNGYIIVSSRLNPFYDLPEFSRVILRPPVITAGVGCRRGIEAGKIVEVVEKAFNRAGLALNCLSCLASGEFKADEEGLIKAAAQLAVPLKIFTRDEIRANFGDTVPSAFVAEQVGVGAVAEPCARLGSGGGKIILPTQSGGGITVALAESEVI